MSPDPRDLLERHVRWLGGWEAIDRLHTLVQRGRIDVAGLSGRVTNEARRDGFRRTEFDLGVIRGIECTTPGESWEQQASGAIEVVSERKATERRRAADRAFGGHLRGEGVAVSPIGPIERDGRAWPAVRFTYGDGDAIDLLVDPDTGESTWERETTDGVVSWHRASAWRTVGGVRVAAELATFHDDGGTDSTIRWETIDANGEVATGRFARPESARMARFAAATSEWQPVWLHLDRYLYVPVRLNGEPVEVVLDSGAGMTVIDRDHAAALGLVPTGSVTTFGVAGRTEAGVVQGIEIALGSVVLGPLTAVVLDLSDLDRKFGRALRVILGKELFQAAIVEVDYPGRRVRFHDPDRFTYAGEGRRVDLHTVGGGHRELEVAIEALPPARVQLDTGSGGTVALFGPYVNEHHLLGDRGRTSEQASHGVGGGSVCTVGVLRSVSFAGYELHDVPATFHREAVGAFATARQAGNLGAGILGRFAIVFDYRAGCLWVEPRPGWDTTPFPRDRSGLQTTLRDGGLDVFFVAPGSPAAEAGWAIGDRIVSVDGAPIGPDWFDERWKWARGEPGTVVRLGLADGTERTLVLRTYYGDAP